MPEQQLTRQEEQLFLTLRHEIMQELGPRVDKILKESILALRGDMTDAARSEVKKSIVDSLSTYGKKNLEI